MGYFLKLWLGCKEFYLDRAKGFHVKDCNRVAFESQPSFKEGGGAFLHQHEAGGILRSI